MSLVLDIDGVLIRNRHLLNHVKKNCIRYVQTKLPATNHPARLNKILYSTNGHTARGLRNLFGIDTSDFNSFVYDRELQTHLWNILGSPEFQGDVERIHSFTKKGWRVTLFTNAPIEWAGPVARAIGDDVFVTCPGNNLETSDLKPEAAAYKTFQRDIQHVFVDDSLANLNTVRWLSNWHPIYFGKNPEDWCPTIQSIKELDEHLSKYGTLYTRDPKTKARRSL